MNALGIYSQDGDRLLSTDFRWTVAQETRQQMLQDWLKIPANERWPVHLKDHLSMLVHDTNLGLLFVAFTLENVQPLQVFEALKGIAGILHSAFGGLSEEKVRGNLHMVMETVSECIDYGIVTQLQLNTVLERIHSKYLAPKKSLLQLRPPGSAGMRGGQFRSILPTENAGAPEVYVDLIEQVSCIITPSGTPLVALCQGTLQMKSYLAHEALRAALKLQPFHCAELAAQLPFMRAGEGAGAVLEDAQLHHDVALLPELDANGNCQIVAPAHRGERVLLTYTADLAKQAAFAPPLTASLVVERDADYDRKVVITVVLRNRVSHRGAQHAAIELPLPRYVEKVSCSASLNERMATCVSEYDAMTSVLHVKFKLLATKPSKSDVVIQSGGSIRLSVKAMLSRPYDAATFSRGTGPMHVAFQMQSLSISGMRVSYLDFVEPDGSKYVPPGKDLGPAKWLRTVATSDSTTFRL